MCDEDTNKDSEDYVRKLSRREFGAVTAATSLAMILPPTANARTIASSEVLIKTPDGVCDALFVHPVEEKPCCLNVAEFSPPPAFRRMAAGLAESGYTVLCVNPYFRNSERPWLRLEKVSKTNIPEPRSCRCTAIYPPEHIQETPKLS